MFKVGLGRHWIHSSEVRHVRQGHLLRHVVHVRVVYDHEAIFRNIFFFARTFLLFLSGYLLQILCRHDNL